MLKLKKNKDLKLIMVSLRTIAIIFSLVAISFVVLKFYEYFIFSLKEEIEEEEIPVIKEINFILSFEFQTNKSSIFTLWNKGKKEIRSFEVFLDEEKISYKIVKGDLPLKTNDYLQFSIKNFCDGKNHTIQIKTENKVFELDLSSHLCKEEYYNYYSNW